MRQILVPATLLLCIAAGCSSSSTPSSSTTATAPGTATSTVPSTTTSPSDSPTSTTAPTTTTIGGTEPRRASDIEAVRLRTTSIATGLDSPVAAAVRRGDPGFYVAEQHTARVVRVNPRSPATRLTVLDLRGAVSQGNEQGLLGLAFSLDGARLYIDYTDPNGHTHVDEYAMRADRTAAPASRRQVLFQRQPFPNHNGGQLAVGRDGMLYIALGDGGAGGDPLRNGQNRNTLLGKILRIDPRSNGKAAYTIPADNPFAGVAGTRGEIWHWGLRNPWRFSFDRDTDDMWIADVGQNSYEEINHVGAGTKGTNFGWNKREGTHPFEGGTRPDGAVDPVFDFAHTKNVCSVTGGFVYRGTRIPTLRGVYVFSDFCAGNLLGINANGNEPAHGSLHERVEQPTSFAQDDSGELYVLSRTGTLWRIDPA